MQYRTQVTQARRHIALQRVCIDARCLRGHVCPQSHHSAVQLVGNLEGLQVEVVAGAREQRLEVFDQRRDDQFVSPARVQVQKFTARGLQSPCRGRQYFLNAFRQ
jgi:hypothetical protein